MLSDQEGDSTSLLRRNKRVVVAMQCNFHRLQLIVFANDTGQQIFTDLMLLRQ